MSPVQTAVTAVLTEKFEVSPEHIRPEATLESLDLDSLALAELALALQETLGSRWRTTRPPSTAPWASWSPR